MGETVYGRELLRGLERKARHWAGSLEEGLALMESDASLAKSYGPAFRQGADMLAALAAALAETVPTLL